MGLEFDNDREVLARSLRSMELDGHVQQLEWFDECYRTSLAEHGEEHLLTMGFRKNFAIGHAVLERRMESEVPDAELAKRIAYLPEPDTTDADYQYLRAHNQEENTAEVSEPPLTPGKTSFLARWIGSVAGQGRGRE